MYIRYSRKIPLRDDNRLQCRSSYRTTWCGGPIPEWFYNQDRDHSATFRQRYLSFLKASRKLRHMSPYNINKINP